ncbi:hypothetical protein DSO57_1002600 [Entomophthora muscae]|uniref:Uncharacterized protein n=1 Tax=Entomophthora muscae TaxID=34485 RepID=A0ACC2U6X8_9FUNG|nr:hypothetical protein DSO57_1002600 [Entomophthora muscae]
MTRDALAGLTHAEGASEWAVTAYKDAQLVYLDPVSLSGVYCVNSIELVWDVLVTLPFKNVPEMGRAHAAACFCFPVEHTVTVSSIMPGIVRPSKKAQKARKPVSKLTKLTDLNQTVNQKWVTAAPVCQLKPAPPCKLTLINQRNMRVTRYKLINQNGCQKLVTQGFFATWTRYLLEDAKEIGDQDSGGIA